MRCRTCCSSREESGVGGDGGGRGGKALKICGSLSDREPQKQQQQKHALNSECSRLQVETALKILNSK